MCHIAFLYLKATAFFFFFFFFFLVCVRACMRHVSVSVCVCRDRDRKTDRDRQTDRQKERQIDRQTDRQTDRNRDRQTETDRQTDRVTDSSRHRQTVRVAWGTAPRGSKWPTSNISRAMWLQAFKVWVKPCCRVICRHVKVGKNLSVAMIESLTWCLLRISPTTSTMYFLHDANTIHKTYCTSCVKSRSYRLCLYRILVRW